MTKKNEMKMRMAAMLGSSFKQNLINEFAVTRTVQCVALVAPGWDEGDSFDVIEGVKCAKNGNTWKLGGEYFDYQPNCCGWVVGVA